MLIRISNKHQLNFDCVPSPCPWFDLPLSQAGIGQICFMSYSGEYFDANQYVFMTFSFLNTKAAFLYFPPDYYMAYGLVFGYCLHTFLMRSTLSSDSLFRISFKTVFWVTCILKDAKKSIQVYVIISTSQILSRFTFALEGART